MLGYRSQSALFSRPAVGSICYSKVCGSYLRGLSTPADFVKSTAIFPLLLGMLSNHCPLTCHQWEITHNGKR